MGLRPAAGWWLGTHSPSVTPQAPVGWSHSAQGGGGQSITASHRCAAAYPCRRPLSPACCPPPAASSSPSGPSGTCRSCTPGRGERGRLVRWQPSSRGTSCLPGAHSPTLATLSRGRAAPSHMHHGRGKLRQGLSHQGGQRGSQHKFRGSQATGTCSPEHSVLSPHLHARLLAPLPAPRRAHPLQHQKLRMP